MIQHLAVGTGARVNLPAQFKKFKRREYVAFSLPISLPWNPPVADAFNRIAGVGAPRHVAEDCFGEFVDGVRGLFHWTRT